MSGIKIAESILVEEYKEEINELLELIGHPEALVTDRSMLWDFWGPREEAKEKVNELSARLGFKVYYNTYLVDIAMEMKRIKYGSASRKLTTALDLNPSEV